MKTFTRVIAVIMTVAVLASLLVACKDSGYKDENILGSWKQTDEIDGNWIWTFNDDGTCRLVGETTGFDSEGTYYIESENNGKIHITLNDWSEEHLFTYAVTPKVMDMESMDLSYHCFKQ